MTGLRLFVLGMAFTVALLTGPPPAGAQEGDRERCLDAGMNDYVTKPINPKKLRDCLVRCVSTEPVRERCRTEKAGADEI